VMFRGDVMQMQNWSHVETVFEALNKMPSKQHGTDIMRVRCVPIFYCVWCIRTCIKFVKTREQQIPAHAGVIC
jgi:Utp25, U3 small nucleolar RNA-associated SSU processome protein 25